MYVRLNMHVKISAWMCERLSLSLCLSLNFKVISVFEILTKCINSQELQ